MGKTNSRALNYHKALTEAVFWLLFNKFMEEHELSNNLKLLAKVFLHNVNKDSWKCFCRTTICGRFCAAFQWFYSVNWIRQHSWVLDAVYKSCQSLPNTHKGSRQVIFICINIAWSKFVIYLGMQWRILYKMMTLLSFQLTH